MNAIWLRIIASIIPFLFAIGHLLFPEIKIDMTTISLLLLSIVPWVLPLLKSLELPGGIKIELKDIKSITDKVTESQPNLTNNVNKLEGTVNAKGAVSSEANITSNDPMYTIRKVAGTDPNLALVGFRIEIEKRIIAIAEKIGIETSHASLQKLIRELQNRKILNFATLNGLMDLISIGNQAAHGAKVSDDAANLVLDVGTNILLSLDNEIRNQGT